VARIEAAATGRVARARDDAAQARAAQEAERTERAAAEVPPPVVL